MTRSESKYRRWHDQIMDRAQPRALDGYCERHHIVPRALGGSDAKSNIVKLTYREHRAPIPTDQPKAVGLLERVHAC